jgi:ComF family protein
MKRLLWGLKFHGQRAVAPLLAQRMKSYIVPASIDLLVPIPTATSRVRQRGYDQAVLLTQELSRQSGLPSSRLLKRHGQAHQVGASRRQRLLQLRAAFRVSKQHHLTGKNILLVDDVLTTGATLEAAAAALKATGARRVYGIVAAQA